MMIMIFLYKEKTFQEKDLRDRFLLYRTKDMDKNQIALLASQMKTKEDLLNLLNLIKKAEIEEMGFDSSMYHPFTEKQLNFYCNPNHTFHRYRQFKIKKKSGGFRQITAPRTQSFMMMLSAVNDLLRSMYVPSEYAMGFTEGRSVVTNAAVHKGKNYVFNIDLKDFFPSIEQARVWKRLQLPPFKFPVPIANLLAGLCAMKEGRQDENGLIKYIYILPQGAPTSPIITNMICDKLDRRLGGLARRFGLRYTRYADDITFSSMHNVYQKNGDFRKELQRIIKDQGFTINESKTRLQIRGSKQEVTGIIVCDKLNVTQKYVREIRNILYMWDSIRYIFQIPLQWFKDIHAKVFGAYGAGFIRVRDGYYGGMEIGIDENTFQSQVASAIGDNVVTEDDFPSGFFTSLSNAKSSTINVVTDVTWNGTVL